MEAKAYLYPNPLFEGPTLTDIWGEDYVMGKHPFLELMFCGLSPGDHLVDLLAPIRLQQPFRASDLSASAFLSHPNLQDSDIAQICIRLSADEETIEEVTCPVSVHRVTGQVKDFDGCPFPAFVWAVEQPYAERPQAMVKTDREGHFALWYPEGRSMRIFIADESYFRSTYECWITIEALKGDITIDPRVGTLELWGLHAWRTPMAWQVTFWPCSPLMDRLSKQSGRKVDYRPRLSREDISVQINEREVPITELHIVDVWAGEGLAYPAHLLELPLQERDRCAPAVIQVAVQTKTQGRGEAWYVVW